MKKFIVVNSDVFNFSTIQICYFYITNKKVTPWRTVLLEKLMVTQLLGTFPALFWRPRVHYRAYNIPPLVRILRRINAVHTFPPYFPKVHSNIILPSTPRSQGLWFDSRRGLGIFLFTITSRTTLGPTQPPTQWVTGALSLG
jgi:hypothetical protein